MSVTDVVTSLFLLTTVVMTRLTLSQGTLRHHISSYFVTVNYDTRGLQITVSLATAQSL